MTVLHVVLLDFAFQKSLQKKQLKNITTFVFPDNQCNANYRYGLVTHGYHRGQGLNVTTGIHWETCIYQSGKGKNSMLVNIKYI